MHIAVCCLECGEEIYGDDKPIAALKHKELPAVKENEIDPTEESFGSYDMVVRCEGCGDILSSDSFTIDPLPRLSASSNILKYEIERGEFVGSFSNATGFYDYINDLSVEDGLSFFLARDEEGEDLITTGDVSLSEGVNLFHLFVFRENGDSARFLLRLYRNRMLEVKFSTATEPNFATVQVEEGTTVTPPEAVPQKAGYNFSGWDFNFENPIYENKTVNATWSPKGDTPYTVITYVENLAGGYDEHSRESLGGVTDSEITVNATYIEHYAYNGDKSTATGKITADGKLVLTLYYTRKSYTVTVSAQDNGSAAGGASVVYGNSVTVVATANKGYHFEGWLVDGIIVSTSAEYTVTPSGNMIITPKFAANTDTPYTVEYYLEKLDGSYEKVKTENKKGATGVTAEPYVLTYTHYSYDGEKSDKSGVINADGDLLLKVYYSRNIYTVSVNIEGVTSTLSGLGSYKYGEEFCVTVGDVYLGYSFDGLFYDTNNFCTEKSYSGIIEGNVKIKFTLDSALSDFLFESDTENCIITGVKNKNVRELTVPDFVTEIRCGALSGLTSLEKITVPFIGAKNEGAAGTGHKPFGYIFGTVEYDGSYEAKQSYKSYADGEFLSEAYYIPETLRYVIVDCEYVGWGAFDRINLSSIEFTKKVKVLEYNAFSRFEVDRVYAPSINAWLGLTFKSVNSTPLNCGADLYFGGTIVDSLRIEGIADDRGVYVIPDYAFYGCESLTSIDVTDRVAVVGYNAFVNCSNVKEISIPFVGSMKSATAPEEQKMNYAFSYIQLTKLEIRGGIINDDAFENCRYAYELVLGDGVSEIGKRGIAPLCPEILVFGKGIKKIGDNGIGYGTNAKLYISDLKAIFNMEIGAYASPFSNCSQVYVNDVLVTDLVIPTGVNEIKSYVLYRSPFTSVTIPSGVSRIWGENFSSCESMTTIYIQSLADWCVMELESSGANPLRWIKTVIIEGKEQTALEIPYGVKTIKGYVFSGLDKITSVKVPSSVIAIEEHAFSGLSNLESIELPFLGRSSGLTEVCRESFFGYIFGNYPYDNATGTTQSYRDSNGSQISCSAYIPNSLKSITVNGGRILHGALDKLKIEELTLGSGISEIKYIGGQLYNLKRVNAASLNSWMNIDFESGGANPLTYAKNLYVDGALVTSLDLSSYRDIKQNAFYGCTSVTAVTFGGIIRSIGENAFEGCTSITRVNLSDVKAWCQADIKSTPVKYSKNIYYRGISIVEIELDEGVSSINDGVFAYCETLRKVTLPESVLSVGSRAFENCTSLKAVVLTDKVTSIGEGAFSGCSLLSEITLPFVGGTLDINTSNQKAKLFGYIFGNNSYEGGVWTVQTVGMGGQSYGFYVPESLKSVVILGGIIRYGAFQNCANIESLTLCEGVSSIERNVFDGMTGVTVLDVYTMWENLVVSESLVELTVHSGMVQSKFQNRTSLKTVTLGAGVTSVNTDAFLGCDALERVHVASLYDLFEITFYSLYANPLWYAGSLYVDGELVTEIVVPDEITTLQKYCLAGCTSVTAITVHNGVTSIGMDAFSGCASLEQITLPFIGSGGSTTEEAALFGYVFGKTNYEGGVAVIQKYYKYGMQYPTYCLPAGLKTVTITGSGENVIKSYGMCYVPIETLTFKGDVTQIPTSAFEGCTSLVDVNIPETVTRISDSAFAGCTLLDNIVIPNGVYYIGSMAFYECTSLTKINVPTRVERIYQKTFQGCTSLTSVTFSEGVKYIEEYAFYGCRSLASISLPSTTVAVYKYAFKDCTSLSSVTVSGGYWLLSATGKDTLEIKDIAPATVALYIKDTYADYTWSHVR